MTQSLTFKAPVRASRVKFILAALGTSSTRWEAVAPLVKARIVAARLGEDEVAVRQWSQAQAFLKRNLFRECKCGTVVKGLRHCRMCDTERVRRQPQVKSLCVD